MTEPKDCRKAVMMCGLSQSNDSCLFYERGEPGICKHRVFQEIVEGWLHSVCDYKGIPLTDAETAELLARLPQKEEVPND
jgi:hypothetical protein